MATVRPFLIVVTGRPASGKTTLAQLLVARIRCPLVSRDGFKEGYVATTGNAGLPGDDLAWRLYEAVWDAVDVLLDKRITLVLEAAWQHRLWAPKLEERADVARIRILHCLISPELARERFHAREVDDRRRRLFHDSDPTAAEKPYAPPDLPVPTLAVDTSDGYSPTLDELVAFAVQDSA